MSSRLGLRKLSWFWAAFVLVVLGSAAGIWSAERAAVARHQNQQQRRGASALGAAVREVLTDESQLTAVLGASGVRPGVAWSQFTAPLMSDPATNSVALVLPVSRSQRAAWSAEHHQQILRADGAARFSPAPERPFYWVLTRIAQRPGARAAQPGTDLAENAIRREALERATRLGGSQATGPIRFLDDRTSRYGVISFAAIRSPAGRLRGWVGTSIQAAFFARQVSAVLPDARIAVEVGGRFLVDEPSAQAGLRSTRRAGGQRWTTYIWVPRAGLSLVPWLVLAIIACLTLVVRAALRSSRARETYALGQVELHVSRERARNAELERSQVALERARRHAEVITHTMAEGYALSRDGELVSVNDALCRMLGYTREELVGMRPPYDFWAPEHEDRSTEMRAMILNRGGGDFEQELVRRSGERFAAEMTARPAYDSDGTLIGLVTTIRDVSERRHQEAELERERRELYQAQALAHVGSWDHVPGPVPRRRWSPELWRIAGLEPSGTAPPPGTLMSLVHPDDKARVDGVIAAAQAAGGSWAAEFRIISGTGRTVHVAVSALREPAADGSGDITRGTVQDITARAVRDAEETALRVIAELVAQAPPSREIFEEVSGQTLKLLSADSARVIRFDHELGRAVCVAGQTADGARLEGTSVSLAEPSRADGVASAPIVVGARVWGRLEVTVPAESHPAELEDRLQRFTSLLATAIVNAATSDQLRRQALTDALTGLPNRRAFSTRLRRAVALAERTGEPLSLAVIDLDNFKSVNDRHGHQRGDAVLVDFARRLRAAAAGGDAIARLGGEEFAWLMPGLTADTAGEVLRAFSARSRAEAFDGIGVVTISAGVHAYRNGDGIEALLGQADAAVYRAKFDGRDQVRVNASAHPLATGEPAAASVLVDLVD